MTTSENSLDSSDDQPAIHESHESFYRSDKVLGWGCAKCFQCECHNAKGLAEPCPARVIFAPGAFKDVIKKTVPLVHYDKDGNRTIIGEATVNSDENGLYVRGTITDYGKTPEIQEILRNSYSFSIDSEDPLSEQMKRGEI